MIAAELMTESPVAVPPTAPIREVIQTMVSEEVRHLPIVDGERLLGIVSERDLRSFSLPVATILERPEESARRLEEPISTVMRGDVVYADRDATIDEVIDLMIEHKIGAVPVVETGTELLVGIVSYIDVLEAARARLSSES